jgi:hypothetical protein
VAPNTPVDEQKTSVDRGFEESGCDFEDSRWWFEEKPPGIRASPRYGNAEPLGEQ